MKTRKKALLVAPETEYGAGADLVDAVLLVVSELDSSPYEGSRIERTRMREQFGADAEINAGPNVQVTTTVPLAGSGAAGTPPNFGMLLRACGLAETIDNTVDSEKVEYRPATDDHESFCVWFVEDGQLQKVPGVRGTLEANFPAGEFPTAAYTLTGLYQRPEVHAGPLSQTLSDIEDEIPVNKQNTGTFSVHGHQGCGQSLTLTLGNEVTYRNLIGCESVMITNRVVTGQVEIEAPDLATKNYFTAIESHETVTAAAIAFEHGKTAGNIITLSAPKVQLSTLSRTDSDGIVHYQMDTRYLPDEGDDEFVLTFK